MAIDLQGTSTVDVEHGKKRAPSYETAIIPDDVEYAEIDETTAEQFGKTQRGLSSRHVQLIVIGGSVGTGLFIGVGSPLAKAGPLSVFLGFLLFSVFVQYPLMHIVAEMCSWLPIRGSVFHFAGTWVDGALGFAAGYIYWYGAVMFVCIEFTAVASVVQFWNTSINPAAWIAIGLGLSLLLNIFAVRYYGESEFISSSLKIFLILGLMLLTIITMLGGNPKGDRYGFRNYKEPGPMKEYLEPGALGRFLGFWSVLIYAAFACGGPDILMMISGEVKHPRKNIPIAAQKCYIRIYLFYILGTFLLGVICPSNDPVLLKALKDGSQGSAASPWVIGIKDLNITGLDHLVNFVVMTSAWSCGNAYVYSSSRTLYSLALNNKAPKVFRTCLKNGVPIYCVLLVGLISCISFLSISNSTSTVFGWFVNLGTVSFLITYMIIFGTYLRFSSAVTYRNVTLYHRTPFHLQPIAAYIGLIFCGLILFFNGFDIFWPGSFTVSGFFTCYFGVFFFFILFAFWKLWKRTKFLRVDEIDLFSGKKEIDDAEEKEYHDDSTARGRRKGWKEKGWRERVYDLLF